MAHDIAAAFTPSGMQPASTIATPFSASISRMRFNRGKCVCLRDRDRVCCVCHLVFPASIDILEVYMLDNKLSNNRMAQ